MHPEHVYFTWPDGRFTYHCATCGDCCKGLGIGLDASAGEVGGLLASYPALTGFLRKRGATWTAFNPRGRCWFLTDDGLCRVEVEHGRPRKPASCRLFPFNRVFRMGEYTVVDYNSVICPLTIARGDARGAARMQAISHESVLQEIATIADAGIVGTEIPSARPDEEARRVFPRERAIAQACFEAAEILEGRLEAQSTSTASDASAGSPSSGDLLSALFRAQVKEGTVAGARERVSRALLGLTGEAFDMPGDEDLAGAFWLTPSMRFNQLFGPHTYDSRSELASILPDIWLTWLHFLGRGARLAGRALDLRQATTIWSEQISLGYLAARWDHAPTLEPGEYQWPDIEDPDRVVRRFTQACIDNRGKRAPLSALLEPLLAPRPAHERVVLARLLTPLLARIRFRKPRL